MRRSISLLCFVFCLVSLPTLHAQGYLRADGTQIVNEAGEPYLLKGMGLGGWMVQEGYMMKTSGFAGAQHQLRELITELIGEDDTQEFYDAWLANHVREVDIEKMHQEGFNSVRLPMHYNLFTLPIEDEPVAGQQTWLDKGPQLTDSLIAWCKARDMYVILDLHAAPGGQGNDQPISDRDEDKPNLWESAANRAKTVALWKHLAELYVDEPTVGGYDLINETNYDLGSENAALRQLYGEIVAAIRSVDTEHLIFIEGNGFANDFRGLTPPFDDNMAYSPHKYWNYNDRGSIQYMLDLRQQQQTPLYLGETGENSNAWFRDAAKLLNDNRIGWAWWPWKKLESVTGPVSVTINPGYQQLVDYWGGNGPAPTAAQGKAALLQLAENLKLENARFQRDVTDALFRQTTTDETLPWVAHQLPGELYAVDYDLGREGFAYQDEVSATYHVSGGERTAWNNGYTYRNDGVDIERTADTELTNGYNVGWTSDGEFLQYTVEVTEAGVYAAEIRVATQADGGRLHFALDGVDLGPPVTVPNTGGYQRWQTLRITDLPVSKEDRKLRLIVDTGGFNIGGMRFTRTGDLDQLATSVVSGATDSDSSFTVGVSKALDGAAAPVLGDFTLTIDGVATPITAVSMVPDSARSLRFTIGTPLSGGEVLLLTYRGTTILATDGTPLEPFTDLPIANAVAPAFGVPGRVEAEDFFNQSGTQLENTTDAGGGQNVGYLDPGDYLDYYINVASAGTYTVTFRVASEQAAGALKLQLVGADSTVTDLTEATFAITGGWQNWQDFTAEVTLPAGRMTLRALITQPLFNLNFFDFALLTGTREPVNVYALTLSPNPTTDRVRLTGELPSFKSLHLRVVDGQGRVLMQRPVAPVASLTESIELSALASGVYTVQLYAGGQLAFTGQVVRQ